ncbi:hypothetical protein ACFL4W_00745 [Planctomycetota bacterium]
MRLIIILALVLMSSFLLASDWDSWVLGGINVAGRYKEFYKDQEFKADMGLGMGFCGELLTQTQPHVSAGIGVEIMMMQKFDDEDVGGDPAFAFYPVYAVFMFHAKKSERRITGFGQVTAGWNLGFSGNDDYGVNWDLWGAYHYGIGGGAIFFDRIRAEVRWNVYAGIGEDDAGLNRPTQNVEYSTISLRVGYKF